MRMQSFQQDISKRIGARGLKLGQLIGDDEKITWLNLEKKKSPYFSGVMALWKLKERDKKQ